LAELLRRHSDANIDVDSIGGTARSSVGTASADSSPPSPSQTNHISLLGGIFGAREDGNEGEDGSNPRHYDGEREQSCEGCHLIQQLICNFLKFSKFIHVAFITAEHATAQRSW